MGEPRQISQIAEQAAELFLADEANQFLDCAVRLMATCMPISAVIKRLQDEIDLLREFG